MNFIVKIFIGIHFLIIITGISTLNAQTDVKKFITGLFNKDITFEVAKYGENATIQSGNDSGKIGMQGIVAVVTSMDVDSLQRLYGRKTLIKELVIALKNSNRDWYANLLLYNITKKPAIKFLFITDRKKWVRHEKSRDIACWNKYVKNYKM